MKLSVKAFTLAVALVWAGAILMTGLVSIGFPNYGREFLALCSSLYPGFHPSQTLGSTIVGTLYGLVDGAIAGAIFAWIYNRLAG